VNTAGIADVLQALSRRVDFCTFLLHSNCADAPTSPTEKRINQTAHNLLGEFLQMYETTVVGAQKKCHNARAPFLLRGRGGKTEDTRTFAVLVSDHILQSWPWS